LGAVAFVGVVAFIFALKTEIFGWFLIYTALSAICFATVVIFI
jgi:hypothetical protein